jgi:hypothetical protein
MSSRCDFKGSRHRKRAGMGRVRHTYERIAVDEFYCCFRFRPAEQSVEFPVNEAHNAVRQPPNFCLFRGSILGRWGRRYPAAFRPKNHTRPPAVSTGAPRCQKRFWVGFSPGPGENVPPEQTSAGRASGRTGRWKVNLNRKANGLPLEGLFCGTLPTFVGI